jgi:phage terminase Nu1 subunit (DNA packaging protein)
VKACCEHYRKIASGRSEEGEQKVLASARARAALAQAEQMELRTQIARGQYVSLDALRYALNDMTITCRQQLLLNIPTTVVATLVQRWPQLDDIESIFDLVDDAVRDVLSQYAEGVDNLTANPRATADAVKPTQARRWRDPTPPRGIGHDDQNREGGEAAPGGSFGNATVARHRRGHAGPDTSGVSVDHAAPIGRNQRRNGFDVETREGAGTVR